MALNLTRCPVCRARFKGDEADSLPCRRCGSDLSLVRQVYRQADQARRAARQALAQGRVVRGLKMARRSVSLVDNAETRVTLYWALRALREDSSVSPALTGER
jgi:hypothetical protein